MNVGAKDRIIRIVGGAFLVLLSFTVLGGLGTTTGLILSIIGVVLLVTGIRKFCPVYKLLGISTRGSHE